jgi:hypothetical protein
MKKRGLRGSLLRKCGFGFIGPNPAFRHKKPSTCKGYNDVWEHHLKAVSSLERASLKDPLSGRSRFQGDVGPELDPLP